MCHYQEPLSMQNMESNEDIKYQITFRLLNVRIEKRHDIKDNIFIQNLSPKQIQTKYPIDKNYFRIPVIAEKHWFKHNAEVVFNFKGKASEIEKAIKIKATNQLENSIINAFILSGLFNNQFPCASHWALDSSYRNISGLLGIKNIMFDPPLIANHEIDRIVKSYKIINEAENDNILFTSMDRFFVAKKKGIQHIYRVNSPNWDKIIDYAIGFETMFLTPVENELSYRFKLNGTTLISKIDNRDKRIIFNALGDLYKLRSKIVHGGNSDSIIKLARKLVNTLSLNTVNHEHDLGLLTLICNQLDDWFYKIFEFLSELNFDNRPYGKTGIWEDWLWDNK